jgi:hypothetical protein
MQGAVFRPRVIGMPLRGHPPQPCHQPDEVKVPAMIGTIGVPREIKDNENRVALTPAGTERLARVGHTVLVQAGAGEGSGFGDAEYRTAGAKLLTEARDVWREAERAI